MTLLAKVISGGQTGADTAALLAAEGAGIPTGGLAPPRFLSSTGEEPRLGSRFGLLAMEREPGTTMAQCLVKRSMANVDAADATVAFRVNRSPGTDKTIGYCRLGAWSNCPQDITMELHRPVLVVRDVDDVQGAVGDVVAFVRKNNVQTLNVCGHREEAHGTEWTMKVYNILLAAFKQLASPPPPPANQA